MSNQTTDNWPDVEARSKAALPRVVVTAIDKARKGPRPQSQLIGVLHKLQDAMGYLGPEQLAAVAQLMQIPEAKITGVATFYHFFRLRPKGQFVVSVCLGTACHIKEAPAIVEAISRELGVKLGETTPDGVFSLEQARCLGICGLAPVILINSDVHGPIKPEQVPALLRQYRQKAAPAKAA